MENTLNSEKSIKILHISVNNRTQELLVAVQGYCMNHILHAILQPQLTHVRLHFLHTNLIYTVVFSDSGTSIRGPVRQIGLSYLPVRLGIDSLGFLKGLQIRALSDFVY
jgi:hypothetical protein